MVTLERREVKMSHGKQICVDYVKCDFNEVRNGQWMLELMRYAVKNAKVREVHSHVEEFDGSESPPGFAAVVLLDESHVSAHCYYENGLLAIDAFTCGTGDPSAIIDLIHEKLVSEMKNIEEVSRNEIKRFKQ
ncbi:TPA: adenosylmethionine decarboxylase [Candidatus Thalassarchaeaceae archaeon]|jgi:S-adenosylmethionine decarboxylase|nr:adenosylmethionine decarboxylase [Euryarchaeota archaeon]DAC63001.1 MAG TPA: adenosylmethionine decarboxylase [Candidatus Poseidoniales archaeon]HII42311.1 adenosylmethionine decarboxylase [Candidatus Thalassarchaeaceae archaeon]MBT4794763.1 adenosylmethionine decarboxylase [Euryarchaeota archaeon]MBT6076195.1 adenosylmethionine decarboxylase [Euryarchaeota archaeon]|tara:strand:- start:1284 stop:1682 length:399 start_codon:yes stop_codon:yes gene_type:complete